MRIVLYIVAAVLILLGGLWVAQGTNIMAGSVMSGQPMWMWIGGVLVLVGIGLIWWLNRRRA
ncbi:MAG: hypothetical protein ABIQ30_12150 [Devosia sp.]